MTSSVSVSPFSATTSPLSASMTSRASMRRTSRSPRSIASCSSRRSICVYDANTLTVLMPCRTRRLSTSSVSSSPSRTSSCASERSRSALAFLVLAFGASSGSGFAFERDVFGDDRAEDFAHVVARLALLDAGRVRARRRTGAGCRGSRPSRTRAGAPWPGISSSCRCGRRSRRGCPR